MKMEQLGENLIFEFCTPRSGSTMLQQMLASHSEIHTLASPWIMNSLMYGFRKDNGLRPIGIDAEYDALIANQNVGMFLKKLPGGVSVYYEAIRLAALHMYGKALHGTGKKYFIDRNIRYYFFIPEMIRTFPNAKFIVLIRNPIAVFTGVVKKWIKDADWKTFRNYYSDITRSHRYILDAINNCGDRIAVVRYEEMAVNPEKVLKELCQKIEICFEDSMVNYGQRIKNMSGFDIVGTGDVTTLCKHSSPVSKYIDNWPEFLDTSQKVYFAKCWLEDVGREVYEGLGYSYDETMKILNTKQMNENEIYASWDLVSDIELSLEKRIMQQEKEKRLNINKPALAGLKEVKERTIDSPIVGEWKCKYGILQGTIFIFNADRTFFRQHDEKVGFTVLGNYSIDKSRIPYHIDLDVKEHFAGSANLRTYRGIFEIEDDMLKINYNYLTDDRWTNPDDYKYYYRIS